LQDEIGNPSFNTGKSLFFIGGQKRLSESNQSDIQPFSLNFHNFKIYLMHIERPVFGTMNIYHEH